MDSQTLASVFADAAAPQKLVFVALLASILAAPAAATAGLLNPRLRGVCSRLVSDLRLGAPALGLLMAAMNSFHMAQTILRIPHLATTKELAPGVLEVSALAGLGALAGLVALVSLGALRGFGLRPTCA